MTLIYRNSPPSIGASTFHRRSEHLWRPCTRPLHPEYNERQYIQYVVPRKLSWPVESYTMRPTPTNWHRRNYMNPYLMSTPACQPQPSCRGWKGCIHNHHDLIYIRLWSNNSSVDIETKEETQLLKDEQTETDVGNGRTYINILWRPLVIYHIQ